MALALCVNLHGIRENEFIGIHGDLCCCLWRSEGLVPELISFSTPWSSQLNPLIAEMGGVHLARPWKLLGKVSLHFCLGFFLDKIEKNGTNGFPGGIVVKNPPASAGDARDTGSILGQEDPLVKELATHSSVLVWKIPWTEEPGKL